MNVDTTSDILDAGKGGVIEGTGPVNGPANGLNCIESTNCLELGIVSDEESAADFGEFREREVGQRGAVDERKRFSHDCQIWSRDRSEGGCEESQVAGDIGEGIKADGLNVTERCIGGS